MYRLTVNRAHASLPAWGKASIIKRCPNQDYWLEHATYSTCPPQDNSWRIQAESITFKHEEGKAIAREESDRDRRKMQRQIEDMQKQLEKKTSEELAALSVAFLVAELHTGLGNCRCWVGWLRPAAGDWASQIDTSPIWRRKREVARPNLFGPLGITTPRSVVSLARLARPTYGRRPATDSHTHTHTRRQTVVARARRVLSVQRKQSHN